MFWSFRSQLRYVLLLSQFFTPNSPPLREQNDFRFLTFLLFLQLLSVQDLNCSFFYLLILHQRFQGVSSLVLKTCLFLKNLLTQKQFNRGSYGKIHLLCGKVSHFCLLFYFLLNYIQNHIRPYINKDSFQDEMNHQKFSNFYSIHRK